MEGRPASRVGKCCGLDKIKVKSGRMELLCDRDKIMSRGRKTGVFLVSPLMANLSNTEPIVIGFEIMSQVSAAHWLY